jgi:crossover junction endodeoxyribonuclease RuvC
MIILGIDPGLARIGYGVIAKTGSSQKLVASGLITTPSNKSLPDRLVLINLALRQVLKKHQPDLVSIEKLFFFKNAKTAFSVGQAWGVITFTVSKLKLPILELTPLQIKQTVTGYGHAEKAQVYKILKMILKTKSLPTQDDTVDAIACAFSACQNISNKYRL